MERDSSDDMSVDDDQEFDTQARPRILKISSIEIEYPGYNDVSWIGLYNPFVKIILDETRSQVTETKYFEREKSLWENLDFTFAVQLGYA